ncbi:UbiA family prenyltransferase [Microbispora siamensis]
MTEARPSVLAIFFLRFAAGAAVDAGLAPVDPFRLLAGALVWQCAIFFVYLFNGVTDVREDRVNGSRRPIARGDLDPERAWLVAWTAAAAALLGALLLGGAMIWLVTAVLVLGYLYSAPPFQLKKWSSATVVVGGVSGLLSYCAGYTSYGTTGSGGREMVALPAFAVAASLWMGLVGTPAKDLPDIAGDRSAGRATFAVSRGEWPVRLLLSAVAASVALAFCAVALLLRVPLGMAPATMLTGAALLTAVTLTPLSRGSRVRRRLPYRAFMTTQYAVHLAVLLPLVSQFLLSGRSA